jgi:hypothetical protein
MKCPSRTDSDRQSLACRAAFDAWHRFLGAAAFVALTITNPVTAQLLPCKPCVGIQVERPMELLAALEAEPRLGKDDVLFVGWNLDLDGTAELGAAQRIEESGAIPWLRLRFVTPSPLSAHLEQLEAELEHASAIAAAAGDRARYQILWEPDNDSSSASSSRDYAFLVKRAAVAVTGAQVTAQVVSTPLPNDAQTLRDLFAEEVAAYLEGVALEPDAVGGGQAALDLVMELDPGAAIIADATPLPHPGSKALALAAAQSAAGYDISFFKVPEGEPPSLLPFKILAAEFRGDLSFDPYSTPRSGGGAVAWSFVRGEDLDLRVIVDSSAVEDETVLTFSDRYLRRPESIDLADGAVRGMYGQRGAEGGFELRWQPREPITVLRLERPGAAEIAGTSGVEEKVTVLSARPLPVEEILRRLQAVEDAQSRRIHTYQGINSTHLRFQFGTEGLEVTFQGELFYRQGQGYDWAWQKFNLNGLRWKGRQFPKVPLIQPERAANMPLSILFRPDYLYSLRGSETVDGRDCWVVDFRPLSLDDDRSLYRGTVWIDRELFVRVRSRAVQLGLRGDVLSNEETVFYSPVDMAGAPASWTAGHNWLPLRMVSQQLWSVFNGSLVVEKETLLSEVRLNDPGFEDRRQELLASDYTMVRDTDEGIRYLVRDKKTGERKVQEKLSSNRIFLGGGVFYDPSLEYPLPLLGVDFFSLDFRDSGSQVNVFFGGALLTGSYADPQFLGSRFDFGADVFAIAVRGSDTLYRDGIEVPEEEVQQRPLSAQFNLGHPLGKFAKLTLTYRLQHTDYAASDNTSPEFVIPVDHFTHTFRVGGTYSRFGYRFRLNGALSRRSDWQPWGLPDSTDYDPDHEQFLRWRAVLAKTFYFSNFRRAGIDLQYVDGRNLDRFSKYELGFFSDVRVRGYESNRIRAERAFSATLSYGLEMGELFRLQGLADTAWVTDQTSGLDNEFAAGVGIAGTVIGPWQTIVRIDLGKAVAGPDDSFTIFATFLKLW